MDFNLSGIKFRINFLFLACCGFVLLVDKTQMAVYSFYAVLTHEISHFIAMAIINTKPESIILSFNGIGICHDFCRISYKKELFVISAGCFMNFLIFFFFSFFQNSNPLLFSHIALPNLIIGIFNLLPVSITDGGRILKISLKLIIKSIHKAEKICFFFSLLFLSFMLIISIYLFIKTRYNITMLLTTVYLTAMLFKI